KIYWAIEDLVGESTDKSRLRGAIDLASHHVYGKARDLQLLPARGVKQRNLGDRWDLAQQAQGLQPALRDAAGVPRHLRGPSHLALDVLDELADLGSGRTCLLRLNAHQQGLLLAVRKPDVEKTIGHERHGNKAGEQSGVLAEQPSPQASRRDRRCLRP